MNQNLVYPINVGRNIAREAAMTYYVLASDIELYPNEGLVQNFLEMIARNDVPLQTTIRKVFPLQPFQITAASQVPRNKNELQKMLKLGTAFLLHKILCPTCNKAPNYEKWIATHETESIW